MKLSATSALVLNWTLPEIWQNQTTHAYLEKLDLSEGNELLELFDPAEHLMHTHAVSNRKYFMLQCAIDFCTHSIQKGRQPQVIILAAGIAPLSVEIASRFPQSIVFDIDKYLMDEKQRLLHHSVPNISFISCDLNDIALLEQQLSLRNWDASEPSLVILEGITYYLTRQSLQHCMEFFALSGSQLACDYALPPEIITEELRLFGTNVFEKIKHKTGIGFISYYDPDVIQNMLISSGYIMVQHFGMPVVQKLRTVSASPFAEGRHAWISFVRA